MARQSRTFQRRSNTPNRSWTGSFSSDAVTVPASTKILLGSFSLSNPNIDETILRTVGRVYVSSDQSVATERQIGAFGLILVSDLAVTAGAASIPGPISDRDHDGWFVYVPIVQSFLFKDATGIQENAGVGYDFDSKAKRKIEEGTKIAIMVENAMSTHAWQVSNVFRMLTMVRGT